MKIYIWIALYFMFVLPAQAQIINGYAGVTNITTRTLSVANVDETNGAFANGNSLILMQMQGNVIGNVSNSASFGNAAGIGSVGRYEICQILSHTRSPSLTSITLVANPRYTYTFDANSTVQVITFPKLGINYTTIANMQAKNWDGTTGGVIAFEVENTLTLAHNVTATGAGFRGGSRSVDFTGTCDGSYFITATNHTNHGKKGEGIYKSTNINYDYARGKILNGGGGGNIHNSGGGGGGNFRAGGDAGPGFAGSAALGCVPSAGGLGGLNLESYVSGARIFMGGGGGGGQQNAGVGSSGGNGGGIVLIKARRIQTTGTGSAIISAHGVSAVSGGNDGQGGGGAGGSIVIQVDTWSIVSTFPITVAANGGSGGNVNSTIHGGGGGGGQGLVIFSIGSPTVHTTTTTNPGVGGCNHTPCTSKATDGTGPNNAGVLGGLSTSLPMQLKYFVGEAKNESVLLSWLVTEYVPIDRFEIERTQDGVNWHIIGTMEATSTDLAYQYIDQKPFYGTSYYRLKQIGTKQDIAYSNMVVIHRALTADQVNVYPNPATKFVYIDLPTNHTYTLKVANTLGQILPVNSMQVDNKITMDISNYKQGVYYIQIADGRQVLVKKLVVQ